MGVFPLRKIKRNGKYLFVWAVLVVVGLAGYLAYVANNTWNNVEDILQKDQTACGNPAIQDHVSSSDIIWSSKFIPQPWKQTYKGRVNLHVFEDWCGSSIASLRKNPHFPLYPHSRITVKKLAVSPNWRNYGLRIFGYIHPYISGEFRFAVTSSFNCEFWLSWDENPENLRLRAYVGITGEEWSAPGEYGKYASQISKPVLLQQKKRFYFELIYKHSDHLTDHVEVAWKLNKAGMQFNAVDSNSLSLYTDESSLKMNNVSHVPLTAASHVAPPLEKTHTSHHRVEMLREDPRDTFFKTLLLDKSRLWGVLPECSYKPSYTVKDRKISRYQGLQFVHLTYVYPNDYTRLTHMESDNTCFYQLKPYYLKIYGFSNYMKLDQLEEQVARFPGDYRAQWRGFRAMGPAGLDQDTQNEEDLDYSKDEIQQQQKKLLSNSLKKKSLTRRRRTKEQDMNRVERTQKENLVRDKNSEKENQGKQNKMAEDEQHTPEKEDKTMDENQKGETQYLGRVEKILAQKELQVNHLKLEDNHPEMIFHSVLKTTNPQPHGDDPMIHEDPHDLVPLQDRFINTPSTHTSNSVLKEGGDFVKRGGVDTHKGFANEDADGWVAYGDSEMEARIDPEIRWDQTFHASQTDFQMLRTDWIDLNCNVSGNLLISQSEVTAVVQAFMNKLQLKFPRFSLQRVVNVEKRVFADRGGEGGGVSRYLLELELSESSQALVRLLHYVSVQKTTPTLLLCNTNTFLWNPKSTIHIIVPVKNQARWVQKFIVDMEELYRVTGDKNVNIIITDYSSTDMDIQETLKNSHLPRIFTASCLCVIFISTSLGVSSTR